ncbi:hypothetical protein GBAR_LOCUS2, partial [Geodia barretti]
MRNRAFLQFSFSPIMTTLVLAAVSTSFFSTLILVSVFDSTTLRFFPSLPMTKPATSPGHSKARQPIS